MAEGASRELVVSAKLTGTPGPWLFLASAYLGAVDGVQVWRGLPPVAQGASATVKVQTLPPANFFMLPVGEWDLNANGFKGILKVAAVDAQGNLNATVFGNQVAGFWDEEAKALVFVRPSDPNNPATFQFYTGYLFANPGGQFTLAGSFEAFQGSGAIAERPNFGWFAQIQIVT